MPMPLPALPANAPLQSPRAQTPPPPPPPEIPPLPEVPTPPELPPFGPVTVDGAMPGAGVRSLIPGMALSEAQTEKIAEIREMLSTQLNSVKGRRSETAEALKNATGADREGLERLLRQLDARILQIEADIEHTARVLTEQPVAGEAGMLVPPFEFREGRPDFDGGGPDMTAISIVFTLFVLAPMALAAARLMWRRATFRPAPAASFDSSQRLERVEQALDSIAVEVERISEGQRFVTRILTEGSAQSVLNAGQRGEAAGLTRREGVRVPVDGQ